MRKIQESGVQKREVNRIYMKKPICHTKGSNFGSVGIIDCSGAFIIFAVGLALSFIIFLMEVMIRRYTERKDANKVMNLKTVEKNRNYSFQGSDNMLYDYNN